MAPGSNPAHRWFEETPPPPKIVRKTKNLIYFKMLKTNTKL